MSGYYHIACHVNMHCSGATYSHFCNKHLSKNAKKNGKVARSSPKNKEKILTEETLKREKQHEMTHVRSKK